MPSPPLACGRKIVNRVPADVGLPTVVLGRVTDRVLAPAYPGLDGVGSGS